MKVGDRFTLNKGIVVEVIQYINSISVFVEDVHKNSLEVRADKLRLGHVKWPWAEDGKSADLVGKVFSLNCGIDVVVTAHDKFYNVTVEDANKNSRVVSLASLRKGQVSWAEFGVRSSPRCSTKVGDVFTLNCGAQVTVVACNGSKSIRIEDAVGNTKEVYQNALKAGRVDWQCFDLPPDGYYVYTVTHNESIVYIGKGKGWRYLHVTSGTSGNLELNRLYFMAEVVVVLIYAEGMTESEALSLEKTLILLHQPKFNKVYKRACKDEITVQ